MRWSWRQGRQRPSSPGSVSAGPARGERACLVDVLGEVDLLPGLALDRKSLDVVIGGKKLDGTKEPASGALRSPHHALDLVDEQSPALPPKGEQADRFSVVFARLQRLADASQPGSLAEHLHIVRVIFVLLVDGNGDGGPIGRLDFGEQGRRHQRVAINRKSTRLNSSH